MQVVRLTDGQKEAQQLLGSYEGSPWSGSGRQLLSLRLPPNSGPLNPKARLAIGAFRIEPGAYPLLKPSEKSAT